MKIFTPEERAAYLASRNRKLMSSSIIFLDDSDKVLILETNYKENWEVPGGGIEENESPLEASIRETKEELGLEIAEPRLILVDYRHTQDKREEMMHFVFFGGVLGEKEKSKIILQPDEIKAFKFADLDEAKKLTGSRVGPRIERALKALRANECVYHDEQ